MVQFESTGRIARHIKRRSLYFRHLPLVPFKKTVMTIEYSLTRTEIVHAHFKSLASSTRYLLIILLYVLLVSGATLVGRGVFSRPLTFTDWVIAVEAAVSFLVFFPVMLFIRAKTSKRSLTVSSEGISTEIGSLRGRIPWKKIKFISDTERYVIVSRTNGNAFFIPSRAFSSPEQKAEFILKIRG